MRETIPRKNIQTINYYKNMESCGGLSDCQELVGPPDRREADNLKTLQSVLYSKNRDLVSSFAFDRLRSFNFYFVYKTFQ